MDDLKKIIIFLIVSFKLLIYIINETIWNSSLVSYLYLLLIFILVIPYILNLEFNKKSFIKTMLVLIISFLIFIIYKEDNVFLYALIALITLKDDDQKIIKTIFYSGFSIYLLTILLGYFEILPVDSVYRTIEGETEIRMSLGFPNSNAVFSYFLPIVLAGICLFDKNLKFNILMIVIATILFCFCKSRTGYYLILISLGINLLGKLKFVYRIGTKSFIGGFLISIFLAVLFGNTKYNFVNVLLSSRPWCYLNYLKLGPLVWGQGIPDGFIIDNLYLRLLANYHVVGFGLYYYIFVTGSMLVKDKKILLAMMILLLYGVFEAVTVVNFVIVIFLKNIFIKYQEENYGKN